MSKYTTEVRYICEHAAGLKDSVGYNDIDTVITAACPVVFDFDFPIFDADYKTVLEKKILLHFYTREIGYETVGLWKLKLKTKLNEIMPYYNKLYETAVLEYNPFYNVSLNREHTLKRNEQRSGESNTDTSGTVTDENEGLTWQKFSDTPQGGITGLDTDTYLTNATKSTNNSTNEQTTDQNVTNTTESNLDSLDAYIEHVSGANGSMSLSKLLKEFRETLINVDLMIIDELRPLFFNLW